MTFPAVPYSLALLKISIVKLTNVQEQLCYNLIILLDKPGWPTRQQDEFRAEWRHGKHCDLLQPLTDSEASQHQSAKNQSLWEAGGYFEEPPVHRPNSPGVSSAHVESTMALGERLFAILLPLQWAEAFKEESLGLFHSDCNIPADYSLLCYFIVLPLPTYFLLVYCLPCSQPGWVSLLWMGVRRQLE